MGAFKIILVPTDFGPSADLALNRAVELARGTSGRIVLLHACMPPQVALDNGLLVTTDVLGTIIDAGSEALARRVAVHGPSGVPITAKVVVQDPRTAILDVAAEENADLIVMGTHGRSGLPRWLLGSTAESVIRASSIPVLTVRAPKEDAKAEPTAPRAKA
ncbi:MAG: universal stress protein [Polyangiaceae bacterium]